MEINTDTLLSMTEKSFVREYLWTPDQKLALVSTQTRGVKFFDGGTPSNDESARSINFKAELDQGGGSFVATSNGLFGLCQQALTLYQRQTNGSIFQAKPGQDLIQWQAGTSQKTVLARIPPSLGLQVDPRERWLSWISDMGSEQELHIYSPLQSQAELSKVFKVSGFLRNVRWHPTQALMLYINWQVDEIAWEAASLYLAEFDMKNQCPTPKSPRRLQAPQAAGHVFMSCAEAAFSPCGRFIIALLRTDEWFQFWSFDLVLGNWTQLSKAATEHAKPPRGAEQPHFALHPTRPLLFGIAAQAGKESLVSFNYNQRDSTPVWKVPRTRDTWLNQPRFSPDGRHISVISASSQNQPRLRSWQYDDEAWYEAPCMRQKPSYRSQTINPTQVQWPSCDGQLVHGILYRPRLVKQALPLIIAVHGGPVDQVSADWPAKAKFFTELGFAFLYVNYRGSWGYGTSYQRALAGHWGIKDSDDVASAVPYLASQGLIDPLRVGLWGGAAGGLTVLNTLIAYPDLVQAAVAVYPYLDLPDLLTRCSPMKRSELKWALGPCSEQNLLERSPLHQALKMRTPLALFHGARDPFIPLNQMRQLQASLTQRGVDCMLKVYEQEAHGWQQEATRCDYGQGVTDFFVRILK